MSRHTITSRMVIGVALLFSAAPVVQHAVAVQTNAGLELSVRVKSEATNRASFSGRRDVSAYWRSGTIEFEKRQIQAYNLVAVTATSHDTLSQEQTSAVREEGHRVAKWWESTQKGETLCCQESLPSQFDMINEHGTLAASTNVLQEHHTVPSKRENRMPIEKEASKEEFVLEPIHLLLLGSGLVALGILRNRHKRT